MLLLSINIFTQENNRYWAIENLRIRSEATTNSNTLQVIQRGTMVTKLETGRRETINNLSSEWFFVQTESGLRGWCFGGFLADSREKAILIGSWLERGASGYLPRYVRYGSNGFFASGVSETGAGESGRWEIREGKIHETGSVGWAERENYTAEVSFEIINTNTIRIGRTVYERVNNSDPNRGSWWDWQHRMEQHWRD